jgi:predicted lipid-binding transport protein (Tim44 family)
VNEAAEVANNAPVIVALSLWWAVLFAMQLLAENQETSNRAAAAPKQREASGLAAANDSRLSEICRLDPEFSQDAFLSGAGRAFEVVLNAYAQCDLETLRTLLSREVFQVFADACAKRQESRETLDLTFIGIESAEIVSADALPGKMEITVLFRAQMVFAERSEKGDLLSGDPSTVTTTADLWTFSRQFPPSERTWLLVATDQA